MKRIFFCLTTAILLATNLAFSQGTAINTTGAAANSSAMLDVSSSEKGFLMPRLTTAERNAISSPANGLMIINSTTNCLEIYFGVSWQSIYCGCTVPATPGVISGTTSVCAFSSGNVYSITAVSGATSYNWAVPAGASITGNTGTSITVTFGASPAGNITVSATNTCGTSAQSSLAITNAYSAGSQTFNYTGSQQTFVVPACVTSVTIDAYGGMGGATGGKGGQAKGTLTVTPGQNLYVYAGQAGTGTAGGWNGGGLGNTNGNWHGGGASDVRVGGTALANRVIVAGGGGGNGCNPGLTYGGVGGGSTGGAGSTNSTANGGGGGTQSAGGAGGTGGFYNGTTGSLGQGGSGGGNGYAGGGGGGYYGGGGGGSTVGNLRGGGGGGSNYLGGVTSIINSQDVQSGDGMVIISW